MPNNIPVVEQILSGNDELAAYNRELFDKHHVFTINMMASPGAGKTSLIEATVTRLKDTLRIAMINGDIATSLDAERAQRAGALAVQINTGGNCHLEAHMIRDAVAQLNLNEIDLLIIENVGNLVCPAGWKLGSHKNVLVASIPEGDDKPYKYPGMYRGVDVMLVNKIDLLPYIPFNMQTFEQGVEILNPGLVSFHTSCQTGAGLDEWVTWLQQHIQSVG
ncbi:MAG: hydrogenase nickel incorporation protein HypB [Anaerolineales bacterium]